MSRLIRSAAVVLATGAAAAGLAACGGSSPNSAAAGPGGRDGANDEAELAFAKCMRAAGIPIPDPGSNGRPQRIRIPRNVTPRKLQAAMSDCRKKTGGGPPELTEEQQTEMRDAALAFAKCMRSNGVDVPDPQVQGGGILIGPGPGGGGQGGRRGGPRLDATPAFRKAMEACRDKLPRFGRGGPGAPR